MMNDDLKEKLNTREDQGMLRSLKYTHGLVDFCSNDYLGLGRDPGILAEACAQLSGHAGLKNGATGSRLITGQSPWIEALEEKLAGFFSMDAALLFNSGYMAMLGVVSTFPQKGDTILYDENSHACVKDGIRLSLADRYSFKHNDLVDLERRLKKTKGQPYIITEAIFSMDGDLCTLTKINELAEKYSARLILDEAHSIGVVGQQGQGLAHESKVKPWILIPTFGKALGVAGAAVLGAKEIKEALVNFSRPFIYTTAPPPIVVHSLNAAIDRLIDGDKIFESLKSRIQWFKREVTRLLIPGIVLQDYAIQSMVYPGNAACRALAGHVQEEGYDVRPILSPTVREGTERIRICIHAYNTRAEITGLLESIKNHIESQP